MNMVEFTYSMSAVPFKGVTFFNGAVITQASADILYFGTLTPEFMAH